MLLIAVVGSHHWTGLVMMHEEEEKSLIHIQEWHQQTIAMVEILHVASETENHFQMLGMGQKSTPTHIFATNAMSKSNNYFIFFIS